MDKMRHLQGCVSILSMKVSCHVVSIALHVARAHYIASYNGQAHLQSVPATQALCRRPHNLFLLTFIVLHSDTLSTVTAVKLSL